MPFSPPPAFAAFVAPARTRAAVWRLVIGVALAAACWFAAAYALLAVVAPWLDAGARGVLLLYLASFAGLVFGVALAVRFVHRRHPATVLGPGGFRPRDFLAGVAFVAAVGVVVAAATAAVAPPVRQVAFAEWAPLLPLALPLVLVQTAAEEALFRGYLVQALAARFRAPLAWALAPALAFGALHWDSASYGRDAWLAVAAAAAVGLAFTDVTVRTGNLSAAIGLHFANNVLALLLVAMPGPTAALALSVSPVDAGHPMRAWLLADIATTAAAWGTWRLALRWRAGRLHSRNRGPI